MTAILAFLLLTTLESRIPTDREIAAQIEQAIRLRMQPEAVAVTVKRRSPLSTTLRNVDMTITGFQAESFPFVAEAPAAEATPPATGGMRGLADTRATAAPAREKLVRVVDGHLTCERFSIRSFPVERMELDAHEARLPAAAIAAGVLRISAAERAQGYLLLSQEGVTHLLGTLTALPIATPRATLTAQGATISGYLPWVVRVPVQVSGRVAVRDGGVLYLEEPRLRVSSVSVPQAIADRLLRDLNPLVDLNAALGMPVPMAVTGLTPGEGTLRLEGTLAFPTP